MAKFVRPVNTKLNERYFNLQYREYTVYVEGEIDRFFWEKIFPEKDGWKPHVDVLYLEDGTVVGGWKNLVNYLEKQKKLKNGKENFIVAIDGDYDRIIHHKPNYLNLVKTKRYALENYLFCPKGLNEYMSAVSKKCFDDSKVVQHKLLQFANLVKNLIIIDCVNEKEGYGIKVYDLNPQDLAEIQNIKSYVTKMSVLYKDILEQNENLLDGYNILDYVRWKVFLKQLNEIIYTVICDSIRKECQKGNGKRNIKKPQKLKPDEGLYTFCLKNCESCHHCPDYEDLKEKAMKAFDSLQLVS